MEMVEVKCLFQGQINLAKKSGLLLKENKNSDLWFEMEFVYEELNVPTLSK